MKRSQQYQDHFENLHYINRECFEMEIGTYSMAKQLEIEQYLVIFKENKNDFEARSLEEQLINQYL